MEEILLMEMEQCCGGTGDPELKRSRVCSRCGKNGRPVSELTVKQQLKQEHLETASGEAFSFCATEDCAVVYFSAGEQIFEKKDLRQKVGLKDHSNPSLLCYCFGFTRRMVEAEVAETGASTIPQRIAREVKAGMCACEVRNPSGSCCLGNVTAAVKNFQRQVQ